MSDQYQDDEDQQKDLRDLREAADRGNKATKEADALRKELAFTKAGIDTDTPLGKMFARSYDGDLDVAKVKESWAEIAPAPQGEVPVQKAPEADRVQLEETATRRNLTAGGAGDTPTEQPDPDPVERGYTEFHERMAKGERRETAAGAVIGSLIEAANRGDERALVTPWTDEQLGR